MVTGGLHILPTHNTPEVIINPEGIIKIKGRALIVNNTEFPEQIMNGLDVYFRNPPETTDVTIAIEYLNSFCSTILVSFVKKLSQAVRQKKKLTIRWYYEEDDVDMLELGKYISEICEIPIDFVITDDITGL